MRILVFSPYLTYNNSVSGAVTVAINVIQSLRSILGENNVPVISINGRGKPLTHSVDISNLHYIKWNIPVQDNVAILKRFKTDCVLITPAGMSMEHKNHNSHLWWPIINALGLPFFVESVSEADVRNYYVYRMAYQHPKFGGYFYDSSSVQDYIVSTYGEQYKGFNYEAFNVENHHNKSFDKEKIIISTSRIIPMYRIRELAALTNDMNSIGYRVQSFGSDDSFHYKYSCREISGHSWFSCGHYMHYDKDVIISNAMYHWGCWYLKNKYEDSRRINTVTIEAVQYGAIPILSNATNPDQFHHMRNCILLDKYHEKELIYIIKKLDNLPLLRQSLREASYKTVYDNYSYINKINSFKDWLLHNINEVLERNIIQVSTTEDHSIPVLDSRVEEFK